MEPQIIRYGHLTAEQTREALGISAGALRNLVYRGQLTRSSGTERYPYFAVTDVAELAAKRASAPSSRLIPGYHRSVA